MTDRIDAETRADLLELIARYYRAFDSGDAETYATLFPEDGQLTGFGDPVVGREALKGLCTASLTQSQGAWRHNFSNATFARGSADTVSVEGYSLVTRGGENPGVQMQLSATFTMRREDEAWLITEVALRF
jgi:uncharacterized protein (TIGR02246 family)